ncbi:hypothetical protein [Dyella japonica]|uniref:Porin n=1 Tax=Dyella japonica DSM 16301 TaxID=1440762 RepID=A0A0G9H413_9GAMM|nr:hypothetical protein [Dyella japonica]KLD64585.1 hypothetical protein Y882_06900 [Dyella japonica DSM 16301]
MKKLILALAFTAMVAPLASQATQSNNIGYNYVQLDYVNVNQTGHGTLADGATLRDTLIY